MKSLIMKRYFKIFLFILIIFFCRNFIFRSSVKYQSIGKRTEYKIQNDLKKFIDSNDIKEIEIEKIINNCQYITAQKLEFHSKKTQNNPNILMQNPRAHCVGYCAFYVTICNYLLKKHKLSDNWVAEQHIGQLYLFGYNLHQCFSSPFIKTTIL